MKGKPFLDRTDGGLEEVMASLTEFLELNRGTASEGIVWDTLKAFKKQTKDCLGGINWGKSNNFRRTVHR